MNLGKWVLVNLFHKFIDKELEYQEEGLIRFGDDQPDRPDSVKSRTLQMTQEERVEAPPAVPTVSIPLPNAVDDGPKLPLVAVTTNIDQSPYLPTSPQAAQFNGPFTAPSTTTTRPDYFSGAHYPSVRRESSVQLPQPAALPTFPTSPTGSNFMHRLKNLSVKAKLSRVPTNEDRPGELFPSLSTSTSIQPSVDEQQHQQQQSLAAASAAAAAVAEKAATEKAAVEAKVAEDLKLKEIEESKSESYTPPHLEDFPPLKIPSSTMIIVAEESAEASTGMDLYRGTVGSSGEDADTIIDAAPAWLLSYLLYVR